MILRFLNFSLILAIFFSLNNQVIAQEKKLNIFSNIDSSIVYIDSHFIGYTPLKDLLIEKDSISITVMDDYVDSWLTQKTIFPLILRNDTTITISFKRKLNLVTKPENASVFIDEKLIGRTPLLFKYDDNSQAKIVISKEGYTTETIKIESVKKNKLNISLSPLLPEDLNRSEESNEETYNRSTVTYLIIGGLAAGLISGYTKMRADDLEDDYKHKKEDSIKNEIYTLDTISNFSLLIFEGCLIAVNYLLLKD